MSRLKYRWLGAISALCIFAAGCGGISAAKAVPEMVEKTEFIFGTLVSLKLYEPVSDSEFLSVFEALRGIEGRMTAKGASGELAAINSNAGVAPVQVSAETLKVIVTAKSYAEASEGAFDPTVLPLVSLWGIGTEGAKVPTQQEIDRARAQTGYKDLIIDEDNSTVFLSRAGMGLDLGGIAKGYGADQTAAKLKALGVESGIINLGGNVFALGNRADGSPWRVGVQNPESQRGEYLGICTVHDQTLVTSGIYERYLEADGKRYHHIIDLKTGYPVENQLAGVSILSKDSMEADALSTSCFVLGPEKGLHLVESLPDTEIMFITKDKKIMMTEGFAKVFKLTDDSFTIVESLQ